MSSGKLTPAGRSLVLTRICGGCTSVGNRDRYTLSQCPWVKSRNMGALQHVATTRRVFAAGGSLFSCRYSPPPMTVTLFFLYRQDSVPPSTPAALGAPAARSNACPAALQVFH